MLKMHILFNFNTPLNIISSEIYNYKITKRFKALIFNYLYVKMLLTDMKSEDGGF